MRLVLLLVALPLVGCAGLGRSLYEDDRDARRAENALVDRKILISDHDIELFEREGEGRPVLLIHGFGGDKDSWNRIIPHLPEKARLIVPSLPGFGASSYDEDKRYDFRSQADRLIELLDGLALEQVDVIGVSMGGAIATTLAAWYPQRIRTLVAICPAGINPPRPTPFQRKWRQGRNELIVQEPSEYDRYLDLLFHGDPPSIPFPVKSYLIEEELRTAETKDKIDKDMRRRPGWLNRIIPWLKLPTLVVWGREDEVLDVSGSTLFEALPKVRIEIMNGCGHACSFVRADEVGAMISAHLRKN